ncbi:MAG TPA: DUF1800 domain-containing protein [Blastocatellia bacterium]|nr:DUF1800 domain-containing protein [Blastocatellia bacterium]
MAATAKLANPTLRRLRRARPLRRFANAAAKRTVLIVTLLAFACADSFSVAAKQSKSTEAPASWQDDLTQLRAAEWNYDRAAHLLERAGFGGTPEEIQKLAGMGPAQAVRHLVSYQEVKNAELPPFRASGIFPGEDFVPPLGGGEPIRDAMTRGEALGIKVERKPGTMWLQPIVDASYYYRFSNNGEITRVAVWEAQRMLVTERPLEEKLALFWHGHFATENDKVRDYRKMMAQLDLYRAHGNGNFRDLLLGICRNPAMLIYLDGMSNVKGHPNENFAREILELFSLGVGNYTEKDIQETARAFTGWSLDGNQFTKRVALHDDGQKTIFGKTGNFDGEQVVDLILQQEAAARFISRKLYRYFVRDELSPALENKLAAALRDNKYAIAPLLETIFLSRDFYSPVSVATQIKNPVHLIVSTYRKLGLKELPGAPNFSATTAALGQQIFSPPNVAGWKGGRTWINPSTMLQRQNFARYVLFPREIPPPARKPMDFVGDIIGQQAYRQLAEMARRGDFTSSPSMPAEAAMQESGFNRRAGTNTETYNVFRGVYNGAVKTFKVYKPDPPLPARVDLAGMLRKAGVKGVNGAVAYFARRFLRVAPREGDRQELIAYLKQRVGANGIDFDRQSLESDLREVLHLIMSLPEYQLA